MLFQRANIVFEVIISQLKIFNREKRHGNLHVLQDRLIFHEGQKVVYEVVSLPLWSNHVLNSALLIEFEFLELLTYTKIRYPFD